MNLELSSLDEEKPWAEISVASDNPNYHGQKDNYVKTSRYSVANYIPLTIYENFRILANDYFLFILVICCLPNSPVYWIYTFLPLTFVILVSMAKSGYEDYCKYKQDQEKNNEEVLIFRDNEWKKLPSKDIRIGDIVKVLSEQILPCDMLYLRSSNEEHLCNYSETSLNGETAVKTMSDYSIFMNEEIPGTFFSKHWKVVVNEPNRSLKYFDGKITCDDKSYAMSIKNVLLRGMKLKYTDWIIGVAIATGHDTKVMKNQRAAPAKSTTFDYNINLSVVIIFVLMMIIVIVFSTLCAFQTKDNSFPIISESSPSRGSCFVQAAMQYLVIFSYMIPISLMVTIEIVRLFSSIIMRLDKDLYDEKLGRADPRNSNILVDLACVTHLLSDKTGTLTENKMTLVNFVDSSGNHSAEEFIKSNQETREISNDMLLSFVLNNTVIVYSNPDGKIEYNAESPDEAAFVKFAAKSGYVLTKRTPEKVWFEANGVPTEYEIVALFPFDSSRKRMSVLLKIPGTEKILCLCKGADNIMYQRCKEIKYNDYVNSFSQQGYRTLVFGQKIIDEEESKAMMEQYNVVSQAMSNRDQKVAEFAETVEKDLDCIGITAIEDKLQENVPETISWIRKAGIKIWVLTGDKLETAIEIGRTSKVIEANSDVLIISQTNVNDIKVEIERYVNNIASFTSPVLVMTEEPVDFILNGEGNENVKEQFLELSKHCRSIIFSRVSPFMKAAIVKFVKEIKGSCVLAVGDGANDVGMIQESNVGVGIYGKEGTQAAQAADFAIPRFKHLVCSIGIHGHLAMHRLAHTAAIMLYKNYVFDLVMFWCYFDTMFSPSSFFDGFLLSCFNLVFVLLPPFAYGFFDMDLPKKKLIAYPEVHNTMENPIAYPYLIYYIVIGVVQSAIIYFFVRTGNSDHAFLENGTLCYITSVVVVLIQISTWLSEWNWIVALFMILSIVLLFLLIPVYNYIIGEYNLYSVSVAVLTSSVNWFTMFACVLFCLLISEVCEVLRNFFRPSLIRAVKETEITESVVLDTCDVFLK